MAATMKDLAQRTGLGLATISSYFNGGNVREKNRIKIEEAIRELHYEVNEVARGLKTNATHTIGAVIPELNSVFCSEIIAGMEDTLRKKGYATIICDCRTDAALEREAMEFLLRKRVDGIMNMPVDMEGRNLELFRRSGKPVVLIDRKVTGRDYDSVLIDNRKGALDAVGYLLDEGHRNIGILSGPEDIFTTKERLLGYRRAYEGRGLPVKERLICYGDYTIPGGVRGVTRLLQDNPDMTALFVTNYEMTMGAVIGLNELGVRIPDELSLVGFDNREFARACTPRLTIVSQPTYEIGRQVASLLLERLGGDRSDVHNISLEPSILPGKSVAALPQGGRL